LFVLYYAEETETDNYGDLGMGGPGGCPTKQKYRGWLWLLEADSG